MTVEQILADAAARKLMPTTMGTQEIRALDAQIRARGLFSARTTSAQYLGKIARVLDAFIGGEIETTAARAELQDELDALGYDPQTGFPGDDPETIPPAPRGGLTDLSSDARINLILETQKDLAYGEGQRAAGLGRIHGWPAWELIRYVHSRVPRDWPARWVAAGGTLRGERMIAHKLDPIWTALGDSGLFDDALDVESPPFAFNSGMGWREVRDDEAAAVGIEPDDFTDPAHPIQINESLRASVRQIPPDIIAALKRDLPARIEKGKAIYDAAQDAARRRYLEKLDGATRAKLEAATS